MRAAASAPAPDVIPAASSGRSLVPRLRKALASGDLDTAAGPADSRRSAYLPGLDGLRALAVLAVLVYHARPAWLPGGFLGVEVFFVVSGFIITRALLFEWQDRGRIDIRAFWLRRARRLLPAVGLLLAGVLAYAAAFQPDEVARLRGDILAALAYMTNWHLILGDQSYFDSFQRPSMLRHLWSLAVEEQFYIVWPLVLAFGLPILKRRGFVVLIVAGIVASTLAMALLYNPASGNTRAYFGTDTRAAGLLVGALLAFGLSVWRFEFAGRSGGAVAALGAFALLSLGAAGLWLDEGSTFLYHGGFLTIGLLTGLLIFATIQADLLSRVLSVQPLRWLGVRSYGIYLWHWPVYMLAWPREPGFGELLLQVAAVLAIAAASYALLEQPVRRGALGRLWARVRAWPAQSLRYRGAVVFSGAAGVAVIASLLAVAVAAKPPEAPPYFANGSIRIQSIVLAQDVGSVVRGPTPMSRVQNTISALTAESPACPLDSLLPGGVFAGVASVPFDAGCPQAPSLFERPGLADVLLTQASAPIPDVSPDPGSIAEDTGEIDWVETPAPEVDELRDGDAPGPEPAEDTTAAATEQSPAPDASPAPASPPAPPQDSPPAQQAPVTQSTVLQSPPSVTAIGDSVMLGAAYTLAASIPGIDLDALVGRQADAAIGLIQQKNAAGLLGQVVVLQIGNNGTFTDAQFDGVMAAIGPDRTVVFVNLKVPRAWEAGNNAVIAAGVSRYANATLVDWATACATYQGLTIADGIHLTPTGATYYTQLVLAAMGGG